MNNNVLILEIGGEGGSIQLASDGKTFLYSTNETTLRDFLAGELSEEELKYNSHLYSTFEEAFESLMERYPVFHLHPLTIDPQYLERIKTIFVEYKSANTEGHQWGFDNWENLLGF